LSWDCLSAEIAAMFASYADRADGRQMSLEWWAAQQRESATERDRARRRTPHRIEYLRKWRAGNAERKREHDRRYREKNKERLRAYWRERKRQKAAERRAA